MAAPHYIAEKVGDKYVLVRKDLRPEFGRPEFLIAGAVTAGWGLSQRGATRRLLISIGGGFVALGFFCARPRSGKPSTKRVKRFTRGPSYPNEDEGLKPRQKPQDDIDEASMESFPASDPPAHTPPPTN